MNKLKLSGLLIISLALLTACVSLPQQEQPVAAGNYGIYKTIDTGLTWQHKVAFNNALGSVMTINDINVEKIIPDPHNAGFSADKKAYYLATNKGLYYTYDSTNSWFQAADFGPAPINDVTVDHFNKCIVYVAAGNTIYKTIDCARSWQTIYFDSRQGLQINELATEWYNQKYIYAGNNLGEVLKSVDEGKTWQKIKNLGNPIKQILVDKDDTRIIYFVTEAAGIFKTIDGGNTWSHDKAETDLNKSLGSFSGGRVYGYLVQDMTRKNSFFLKNQYGLLKTSDGGLTWQEINLITPAGSANIFSLAVDPKESKNIYYGTDTTLYKTTDGGENWQTLKSPTPGIINVLLFDEEDSKIIYLGTKYKG